VDYLLQTSSCCSHGPRPSSADCFQYYPSSGMAPCSAVGVTAKSPEAFHTGLLAVACRTAALAVLSGCCSHKTPRSVFAPATEQWQRPRKPGCLSEMVTKRHNRARRHHLHLTARHSPRCHDVPVEAVQPHLQDLHCNGLVSCHHNLWPWRQERDPAVAGGAAFLQQQESAPLHPVIGPAVGTSELANRCVRIPRLLALVSHS
jgi:hypothetical protein